ncbi:hypothetical protein [Intestinibacter sp.]|uniref:hypothetical protein n=1 Tax=Intestinibacter sp. TaxID=1965304 RepID=UPI002A751820|nr:hypothetical protein [Intestinibacter sp.]MDY2736305.1 hypothetical protein [Intestinibacter sp.]
MLKKTITYEDFNGVERKEDFYFNLSKAEIMEMQFGTVGGLDVMLKKIIDAKDVKSIMDTFKMLILKAYGIKSDDGRRFIKSEEISKEFEQTEAYSILYMELASDDNAAAEFVNGIIPKDVATEVSNQMKAIN